MSAVDAGTPWARGRLDERGGPARVLFGRMYEDTAIEAGAFAADARVFCIASAGCTAIALAPGRSVVAVDVNPVQLAYAARRLRGEPAVHGLVERGMSGARAAAVMAGWRPAALAEFLAMDNPVAQTAVWRERLDTRRFRLGFDSLMSLAALRAVYADKLLSFLPPHLGAVLRGRLARGFALHPNCRNPYAQALFAGALPQGEPPPAADNVQLVHADAAAFLEGAAAGSFDAFSLSNILDGAATGYRQRLFAAVRHAAAPGAQVVVRSFAEPPASRTSNRAADDRAMLWGIVDVRPAETLE